MQSLIETVVKMLVDKPDEVNVEAVESDQTIIYELTVGDGDYGTPGTENYQNDCPYPGDMNNDGLTNILDVIILVNVILDF